MATNSNDLDFTVPIISGPTKAKLEAAIDAVTRAARFKSDCIAAAAAQGRTITYLTGNDDQYHDTILANAYLSWIIKGRLINYYIKERADIIYKLGDNYVVEFDHWNKHTRYLFAPPSTYYLLEPEVRYDYRIIYNPDTGIGRVSMLGKSAI